MKRYAIVRVEGKCPAYEDNVFCGRIDKRFRIVDTTVDCNKCKIRKYYGDTKEQLIRKIETAVAIMRNKMENKEVYLDRAVATFIVEFLGVK